MLPATLTSRRAGTFRRVRHCHRAAPRLHSGRARIAFQVRCARASTPDALRSGFAPNVGKRTTVKVSPLNGSFDFSGLLDEFRDEAIQQVDTLDAALLGVEQAGRLPAEEHSALLRALHTLKGNAGMLGLRPLRDAVHSLEEIFKEPPGAWPQPLLDRLFVAAAALRRAVEQAGREGEADAFERLAGAAAIHPGEATAASRSAAAEPLAPAGPEASAEAEASEAHATEEADRAAEESAPGEAAEESDLPEERGAPVAPDAGGELLRVPFAKLDALLARIGQLVEVNSVLAHELRLRRETLREAGLWRPLTEGIERIDRVAEELQSAAMELRLVPIGRVLARFPSLARELALEQGKRVQVRLEGETTELDKSTVDALAEPLLHLIRNAVDHGIEPPEEREENGKPPEGTLLVRATQVGDRVRVEVEDDGRGLDRRLIRARAEELGLVDRGAEVEERDLDALVFHPGFTTRRKASTTSGRGIGLDVVVRSVARLRGTLDVEPRDDGGTRFVLELPLTLLILPALLFESEGEMLALPSGDVVETIRPRGHQYVGGVEVVRHGGGLIPLARPARIFGWTRRPPAAPPAPGTPEHMSGAATSAAEGDPGGRTDDGAPFAIVVRRGARGAAVAADRLVEQRDVVIKALPAYLGQPYGISGASVAPSGRVILLLDAGGVIDLNLDSHRRERRAR